MIRRLILLAFIPTLSLALSLPFATRARLGPYPAPEQGVQAFLDAVPGVLKTYHEPLPDGTGQQSAAEALQGTAVYYGLSPRLLLALAEASNALLSDPQPTPAALRQPFGNQGPTGFANQVDWAAAELRAGLGPYERPPVVAFSDGTTLTLTLDQAAEGVAVQRFLAKGRSQAEWRRAVERFGTAFQVYFDNQLPDATSPPATSDGWLRRPWQTGTRVTHLAYFDHMYPTVDTGRRDNGYVVNYLGRGNLQYDGHDGHDYFFPDDPIGTPILAAADGIAYASTHRGNGVWIKHPGGYETVYWHLDRFATTFRNAVNTGRGIAVKAGDFLGTSGRSGFVKGTPHLHFEVRFKGRQVDPYGWFGAGPDPCASYAGCAASTWLWHPSLLGEFDFTPPPPATPDRTPPLAALTLDPVPDLLLYAPLAGSPLQQVGQGAPLLAGQPAYEALRSTTGIRLADDGRLAFPTAGNLNLQAGTIAFWANIPAPTSGDRNVAYLLAASANPESPPVYTGTLALRRDVFTADGSPQWNFWTVGDHGEANNLLAPATTGPALHHIALSWEQAGGRKWLFVDGKPVAEARGAALPNDIGERLALGRYTAGVGTSGITIGELAIYGRVLTSSEIATLAAGEPLVTGALRSPTGNLQLDLNALDDAGGIVAVQLGVDGVFGDPQPFADSYTLNLAGPPGQYAVAARVFDRAGNSSTVSATITLATRRVHMPSVAHP